MVQLRSFVFVLAFLVGCFRSVQGSGRALEEPRPVAGFRAIEVGNGIRLEATVGAPTSVRVRGDDNIVPLVRTELRGDTLTVHMARNTSVSTTVPLVVTVTTPDLARVEASSGSAVRVVGVASAALSVHASSGASAIVAGRAGRVESEVSSGARVDTTALYCTQARVQVSSGGHAAVYAAASIDGAASSGGAIDVIGNPANRAVHSSSGGSVTFQ